MKTAFLISVMAPLALFGAFADKDWVKRTFAPTNAAAVADAAAVTNAQQAAAISDLQGGKQDKLPYATNAIPDSAITSAATWNAKQDAISDYTTTGAVHSIVSNDVASWAMAGQPQPLGSVTDVKVDGTSVVSNGVAGIVISNKQDRLSAGNNVSITERAQDSDHHPFAYRIVSRIGNFLPGKTHVYSHWPDLETETHDDMLYAYTLSDEGYYYEYGYVVTYTEDGVRIGWLDDPANVYCIAVRDRHYDIEGGGLYVDVTVPTQTSDLINDSGFLTQHQDISGKQDVLKTGGPTRIVEIIPTSADYTDFNLTVTEAVLAADGVTLSRLFVSGTYSGGTCGIATSMVSRNADGTYHFDLPRTWGTYLKIADCRLAYDDRTPVETTVDKVPSSVSTNRLVTSKGVADALSSHTGDTGIHVTAQEKTAWNSKQDAISDYTTTGAVHSIVSGDVASWAMAGQPQPLGSVTDVKVDGTSVVSNGVADITMPEPVDLSGKQDVLKIPVSFGEWNYEAIEGGSHIGEISYPYGSSWYVGLKYVGETGMTVVLATHADGSGVKAADNPTEAYAEWGVRGDKPTVRVRIYRTSVLAPVSDGVDVYPHSFGSNTLVTSKGVYDAMSTKATMGYIGLNVAPEWAANTAYSAGDYVTTSIDEKRYLFRSTMNHTSGSSFPVGSNKWMDVTDYVTYVAEAAAWNKSRTKADASALSSKADKSYVDAASNNVLTAAKEYTGASLPTKVSDLTNDSGFITSSSLPTKVSDLTNDAGFVTATNSPTPTSIYSSQLGTPACTNRMDSFGNMYRSVTQPGGMFLYNGRTFFMGSADADRVIYNDTTPGSTLYIRYTRSNGHVEYSDSANIWTYISAGLYQTWKWPENGDDINPVTDHRADGFEFRLSEPVMSVVPYAKTVTTTNAAELGTAEQIVSKIPTKVSDLSIDSATTNVIREVTGTFWDPGLTVTWRMFCTNGNFYVSAITNVNVTGVQ